MINNMLPPAVIFIVGALLIPFFRGKAKAVYMLALPVVVFITLLNLSFGNTWMVEFWGYKLIMGRVDKLSLVFSYAFTIMAFLGVLFGERCGTRGIGAGGLLSPTATDIKT